MCTLRSGARRGGRVGVALPILTFLRARLRLSGTRRGGRPASRAPSHGRPSDDAAQGLVASLACTVCYRRCMASCVRACAGTAGRPLPAWRAPAARPADSVCRLRAGRWRCASARTRLGKLGYVYIPYVYPTLASAVCVQGAGAAAPPGQGGGERPGRGGRQRAALPRGLPRARVPVRPRPAPHVRAARSRCAAVTHRCPASAPLAPCTHSARWRPAARRCADRAMFTHGCLPQPACSSQPAWLWPSRALLLLPTPSDQQRGRLLGCLLASLQKANAGRPHSWPALHSACAALMLRRAQVRPGQPAAARAASVSAGRRVPLLSQQF